MFGSITSKVRSFFKKSQPGTFDLSKVNVHGHIKISNPVTGEVYVDKDNAINKEAMSYAIALCLSGDTTGHFYELDLGNGGATVNGTGAITYFGPNVTGLNAQLYNQTFSKIIDQRFYSSSATSPNNENASHTAGTTFSDIQINCLLDYNEPAGQSAFDNGTNINSTYTFNEMGLRTFNSTSGGGYLVTHVIFSPVQKALNVQIQILYTIRISLV